MSCIYNEDGEKLVTVDSLEKLIEELNQLVAMNNRFRLLNRDEFKSEIKTYIQIERFFQVYEYIEELKYSKENNLFAIFERTGKAFPLKSETLDITINEILRTFKEPYRVW